MNETYRVVQTTEAFKYPRGTVWGPYSERLDADQRLELIQRHGGAAVVELGPFGAACQQKRSR